MQIPKKDQTMIGLCFETTEPAPASAPASATLSTDLRNNKMIIAKTPHKIERPNEMISTILKTFELDGELIFCSSSKMI